MTDEWQVVAQAIAGATGQPFQVESATAVSGGNINRAYKVEGGRQRYFVKLNAAGLGHMFEAESKALRAICATESVRAPLPLCAGECAGQSWLVMELLQLRPGGETAAEHLGAQLARMHRCTSRHFGWKQNNTIGSTPQINTPCTDWVQFYGEHRLGFQLKLVARNGAGSELIDSGAQLQEQLGSFFTNYQPQASLLHGDLWGGNWASTTGGQPVIFDPAIYFGDREADLAMTELFGGFSDRFYQSYVNAWAIDPGYSTRKVLYNLYHVLNHFNLFGGSYARQAQSMINSLLAEIS